MPLRPSQPTVGLSRQAWRHYSCQNVPKKASIIARSLSTTCSRTSPTSSPFQQFEDSFTAEPPKPERPRWDHTPEGMKAPFSPHIRKGPKQMWKVNDDPQKLDTAINMFLGHDGSRLLPEEVKWQAVTHKSFDQGRRGFNERLSFIGRQICIVEATEHIIHSPRKYDQIAADPYAEKRQPFDDTTLRSVDNLYREQPVNIITADNLAKLAFDTGLSEVVRWRPRMPDNLSASGVNLVMATAVFALVGAVALQHGGKAAHKIAREKIMRRFR